MFNVFLKLFLFILKLASFFSSIDNCSPKNIYKFVLFVWKVEFFVLSGPVAIAYGGCQVIFETAK